LGEFFIMSSSGRNSGPEGLIISRYFIPSFILEQGTYKFFLVIIVQRPKVFEVEGSDKSPLKSSFGIMDVNDFTLLAQYTVFSLKTLGFSPCSLNSNRGEHLIRISYG